MNNTTCSKGIVWKAEIPVTLFIGIVENLIVMVLLCRLRLKKETLTHFLIKLMTISNLFYASILVTQHLINTLTCDEFRHNIACNIMGLVSFVCFMTSILVVTLLSTHRYILLTTHFKLLELMSIRNVFIFVIIVGLFNTIITSLPLYGFTVPYNYYQDNRICGLDVTAGKDSIIHTLILSYLVVYGLGNALMVCITSLRAARLAEKRGKSTPNNKNTFEMKEFISMESDNECSKNTEEKRKSRIENALDTLKRKINLKKYGREKFEMFSLVTKVIAAVNTLLTAPFFVSKQF